MGENVWRDENDWPLARADETEFYLSSGGNANSVARRRRARPRKRRASERPMSTSTTRSTPCRPTAGSSAATRPQLPPGAFDQRAGRGATDVLVYKTPPLAQDVEVTGPVRLQLWASTSAPDTDFTAKLVDVYPDGYARNLTDGIIRARYRQGTDAAAADHARRGLRVHDRPLGNQQPLPPGHRIGLEVSSSNFPRFDRNPNTGHELGADAEMRPAMQTIFHDREHPSRLTLPIVPR